MTNNEEQRSGLMLKIGKWVTTHEGLFMYSSGFLFGLFAGYFMMKDPGKYSSSEVNAIIRLHMDGHLPANDDYKVVTANDHVIVVTPDGNFAVCDDLLKSR